MGEPTDLDAILAAHTPGDPVTPEQAATARQAARDAGVALSLPPLDGDALTARFDEVHATAAAFGDPAPSPCWHMIRCGYRVPGCYGCGEWGRWRKRWPL